MRLGDLVARLYDEFDVAAAMADVSALCRYDRYQASEGIATAADYVAERATEAGLDVEVLHYPNGSNWWTYQGPPGWTPVSAALYVGDTAVLCYPEQPYALAAYSVATPSRSAEIVPWSIMDGRDLTGALLVVDRPDVPVFQALGYAAERGAVGVVADPLAGRADREAGQVGRIELPPGSGLVAFSATSDQVASLCCAAGTTARVTVTLSTAATTMPVVTGRLAGADDGEFLLSAHLCHPRPSANDNASGVAALLGVARMLTAGYGPSVRFLWGPEFVGTAAYLHGAVRRPTLALNVDMAGQYQDRCGSVLVIERSPDELPSFLSALAERCAALLPAAVRSYSGAVSCERWAWRATPHLGASDHALLVAAPSRCPAVGLGHWPDRFNHSSADTLDKVDPAELRRTATIAAASVAAVQHAPSLAADLVDATVSWAVGHMTALPGPGPVVGPGMLDPWGARRVAHRTGVALGTVRSLASIGVPVDRAVATVSAVAAALSAEPEPDGSGPVLVPNWVGPFNLRALAGSVADRHWLDARIAADRGGNFARMHALVRGLDGRRTRSEVAWWAALASELPMSESFVAAFLDILVAAGWALSTGEN